LKFLSQILDVGERKLNVHRAFTDLSLARNPPARPLRH